MPAICLSEDAFAFPPLHMADEEGLLLIGGQVTPQRVIEAYSHGIFPWYSEDGLPLWWSPDPRFVLFPADLHISHSMQKLLRKHIFSFRINTAFEDVIEACATVPRNGQDGTWITPGIKEVYTTLHRQGVAMSAEAWHQGVLAGGVYGLRIGHVFFGESMFSLRANASKFAFISLVQHLSRQGVKLIDCQVFTPHMQTLGATLLPRNRFIALLQQYGR